MKQLTLGIRLRDDADFENFYPGCHAQLISCLKAMVANLGEHYLYVWGSRGAGRTHLLQACCQKAAQQDLPSAYLPMKQIKALSPALLEDLEALPLVCVDDMDAIAGNAAWEESFFHFYNRLQVAKGRLVIAASAAPFDLAIGLPDLRSRLSSGLVFHMENLTDEEKLMALQLRAKKRGLELSEDVGQFLLRRCLRDMTGLYEMLESLDQASFTEQRRLTIPFVKSVLRI